MVGDVVLCFEPEAVVEGEVLASLPGVVGVEAGVGDEDGDGGRAGGDCELAGAAARSTDRGGGEAGGEALHGELVRGEGGEGVLAVVVCSGAVAVAVEALADAEAKEVLFVVDRGVVLDLVGVLIIGEPWTARAGSWLTEFCAVRVRMYWNRRSLTMCDVAASVSLACSVLVVARLW